MRRSSASRFAMENALQGEIHWSERKTGISVACQVRWLCAQNLVDIHASGITRATPPQ